MPSSRCAVAAVAALGALLVAAGPAAARSQHAVCPGQAPGAARCHAHVVDDGKGTPLATAGPAGFNPADLQAAYKLAGANAAGRTVAIVDAYDDPTAESDLAVYRSQFGMAPCTTANGCFKKVNQTGGTRAPRADFGWAQEISLDVDMVSAACPSCKILLVEASSNRFGDLLAAEDWATSHSNAVSNSWGGSEFSAESTATYDGHFNRSVPITVSSGDNGFGAEYPAASRYVTAVGGTSLRRDGSARGFAETAWSGAGSGCSAYEAKPAWQTDTGCARRTIADVSAVADPNTGVSVYDTYRGAGGWLVFGGTSASAPLVASVYALAGNAVTYGSYPYSHAASLFDVVGGTNGSCVTAYLCTAVAGYDGPTGLGTPNGTGAF
jgi:subtilase family serine protease